jgi:hypothetical protein
MRRIEMRELNTDTVRSDMDLDWLVAAWNRLTLVQLAGSNALQKNEKGKRDERHNEILAR